MEYVGLLVVVFIVAVVSNIIMGIIDLRMKNEAMNMLDYVCRGMEEEEQARPQTIALSQEQIHGIAQLVINIIEAKKTKE